VTAACVGYAATTGFRSDNPAMFPPACFASSESSHPLYSVQSTSVCQYRISQFAAIVRFYYSCALLCSHAPHSHTGCNSIYCTGSHSTHSNPVPMTLRAMGRIIDPSRRSDLLSSLGTTDQSPATWLALSSCGHVPHPQLRA